jgi:hypothetical protein
VPIVVLIKIKRKNSTNLSTESRKTNWVAIFRVWNSLNVDWFMLIFRIIYYIWNYRKLINMFEFTLWSNNNFSNHFTLHNSKNRNLLLFQKFEKLSKRFFLIFCVCYNTRLMYFFFSNPRFPIKKNSQN